MKRTETDTEPIESVEADVVRLLLRLGVASAEWGDSRSIEEARALPGLTLPERKLLARASEEEADIARTIAEWSVWSGLVLYLADDWIGRSYRVTYRRVGWGSATKPKVHYLEDDKEMVKFCTKLRAGRDDLSELEWVRIEHREVGPWVSDDDIDLLIQKWRREDAEAAMRARRPGAGASGG